MQNIFLLFEIQGLLADLKYTTFFEAHATFEMINERLQNHQCLDFYTPSAITAQSLSPISEESTSRRIHNKTPALMRTLMQLFPPSTQPNHLQLFFIFLFVCCNLILNYICFTMISLNPFPNSFCVPWAIIFFWLF